jgi:hypothetical protein
LRLPDRLRQSLLMTFIVEAFDARTGRRVEPVLHSMSAAERVYDYLNSKGWVAYNIVIRRGRVAK